MSAAHDLDRAPSALPHSTEAEQSVLGGLLVENAAWSALAGDGIAAGDFADDRHGIIFATIANMACAGEPADIITVHARLAQHGEADRCGGLAYLNALAQSVPSAAHILQYAGIVREQAARRSIITLADSLKADATTAPGLCAVIAQVRDELDSIQRRASSRDGRETHPLARFVELGTEPEPPQMVIPGFVQAGVVVIAGTHGAGKTTALVPLAMIAAGLHAPGDPLAPKHWRHVVYIAEDESQVRRILHGVIEHAGIGAELAAVRERFHVVPACRLPPEEVAAAGPLYRKRFTRAVQGVELPPLVVIDTKSATVEAGDENDNAEAGRMVALFKQQFAGLPLWLVGHVAKYLTARKDVQGLSARGASAIEADAHQCVYLVAESDGRRFLVLGKRRFEPQWPDLEIRPGTAEVSACDEWGEPVRLVLRWGWPTPPQMTRAQAIEQGRKDTEAAATEIMQRAILDAVEAAERAGNPLARSSIESKVTGRSKDIRACVAELEHERWLLPVPVPFAERTNPRRAEFMVRLNDAERQAVLSGQALPAERLIVPASWRKSAAALVSPVGTERAPNAGSQKATDVPSDVVPSLQGNNGGTERAGLDCPRPFPFRPGLGTKRDKTGQNGTELDDRRASA